MDFPPRPSSSRPRRDRPGDPPEVPAYRNPDTGEWDFDHDASAFEEEPDVPAFASEPSRDLPDEPPGGEERSGRATPARMRRRARSETLSRLLWVIPWLIFAVTVIAVSYTHLTLPTNREV